MHIKFNVLWDPIKLTPVLEIYQILELYCLWYNKSCVKIWNET